MSCKCQRPLFSASTTISGGKLVVNLPATNLCNKECLDFVITQTIPTTTPIPVVITLGSSETQYPLMTRYGNYVYSDQIRNRKVYIFRYMSDSKLFFNAGCNNLKCTSFDYPVLPIPTTPTPTEVL